MARSLIVPVLGQAALPETFTVMAPVDRIFTFCRMTYPEPWETLPLPGWLRLGSQTTMS
jgi:hypothetical protein